MGSTDTREQERQLDEAGNKLLQPPSSVDQILSLLDEVENYLSRVEQSPSKSMQTALSPSRKALVSDELLKHQDADVKVAVASCISEITRITAPDAPYDDDQMMEIFQLIVSSFENLSDKSSRSYDKRTLILETVAKVRSCVVMLDLECEGLIVEMFEHFLKAIREDHPYNVFSSMETIMTLVLEESEDISLELISPILASLKSENQGVPAIARKLAERVFEKSAIKLRPCLTQAVKSSRLSLDDYNKVITSICSGTADADGQHDHNTCVEQSDENKLVVASPKESAQDQLNKERVPETWPAGDNPVEDISPKSVMRNGVADTGCVDRTADRHSTKEREHEQAHQIDQSVDTTVTSNGAPDESVSGKSTKSDTKAEETSKKRASKPKSLINSTDPLNSSRVDSDKEAETTAHHERSLSKEVRTSPSGEPSVEVLVPPVGEKENIQISSSKEIGGEALDVATPSSSGNVPIEGRLEKGGRAKKSDKLIREVALSADVSKEASDGTCVLEGKPQRRSGKKATAGRTTEGRTPVLADKSKSEGGSTSDSEEKPLKLCVRKADPSDKSGDQSSLKSKEEVKRRGCGKVIVKNNLSNSHNQDYNKEMIPSPKPVLNLAKKLEEDTLKTSSKRKLTPVKDEVEEDVPKTSTKRKRTPVEEKVEEETPNTSSKKKSSPAKEKASDAVKYGVNLVGSKVKVWWAGCQKFYEGVIVWFDPVKKKHKVEYNDGYKEILNLEQERWEFVGDDSMSDAKQPAEYQIPYPSNEMKYLAKRRRPIVAVARNMPPRRQVASLFRPGTGRTAVPVPTRVSVRQPGRDAQHQEQPESSTCNKRPREEADVDEQPLLTRAHHAEQRAPTSPEPKEQSFEGAGDWAPQFISYEGRRVQVDDSAGRDPSIAIALSRAVLLPCDARGAAADANEDTVYAKQCQDLIMALHRGAILHRRCQDALNYAQREMARADELEAQLTVARVAIDTIDRQAAQAQEAAKKAKTEAVEVKEQLAGKTVEIEALHAEVERVKEEYVKAEDRGYNMGFDDAEVEYRKQVANIKVEEYAFGARAGFYAGYKLLLEEVGVPADSSYSVVPEPKSEWLERPPSPPAESEATDPPPPTDPEAP